MSEKDIRFNKVLVSAKKALDSIKVPFHLHAGTALGVHREKRFIPYDHDIDIAIFYNDVNTKEKLDEIIYTLQEYGFEIRGSEGKLKRGYELQVSKNGIPLDLFWVYDGEYRGKPYYTLASYYGLCDELPYKTCVWGYRPYKLQNINFFGNNYKIVPKKTLVDMYGPDWETPKQFGYYEGITGGAYKGFLRDYYNPRPTNNNVAFCFLLYDSVKHGKIWTNFFSQDNYPVPSYKIYTHLKTINDKTQNWVKQNKIPSVGKTEWCGESLVWAWIQLLYHSLKDPNNKYFILLSGECIPLFTYAETYKKITASKKSRVNIDYNSESFKKTGIYYADQWVLLTRREAELLLKLRTTKEGREFTLNLRKEMVYSCPDEVYPVNWFIYNYGKPSTKGYSSKIRNIPTTYTSWEKNADSPRIFDKRRVKKTKDDICDSEALFARKFNKLAANCIAMKCGEDYDKIC